MKKLLLILSLFLFTGCISLTKDLPAYNTYTLNVEKVETSNKTISKSIKIYEPRAINSLNSTKIVYKKDNLQEVYALSKWSDTPSLMLEKQIITALGKAKYFSQISTSKQGFKTNYSLKSELISFNQKFVEQKAFVEFSILVYFIKKDITYKTFSYEKEVNTLDALGAVKGLNEVTNLFIRDLNIWLMKQTNKD